MNFSFDWNNGWSMLWAGLFLGFILAWIFDWIFWRRNRVAAVEASSSANMSLAGTVPMADFNNLKAELADAKSKLSLSAGAKSDDSAWQAKLDACAAERARLEAELSALKSAKPVSAPVATSATATAVTPDAAAGAKDPLEKLDGIGPVFERKLWDAGILTFAQLAASTPERVTEIIKPEAWQKIEPEKWIAEAAKFARGDKK